MTSIGLSDSVNHVKRPGQNQSMLPYTAKLGKFCSVSRMVSPRITHHAWAGIDCTAQLLANALIKGGRVSQPA